MGVFVGMGVCGHPIVALHAHSRPQPRRARRVALSCTVPYSAAPALPSPHPRRQGLLEAPKPKVKISNLMRVLGAESAADPTAIEQEVRKQMQERQAAHDDRCAGAGRLGGQEVTAAPWRAAALAGRGARPACVPG